MKKFAILLLALASCNRQSAPNGEISLSGRIEGDEVDLAFKLSGRVIEIAVREGDHVTKGQVLARLSGTQEEIRVQEAQAHLAGAIARLNQTKLSIATLEQRLNVTRIQQDQATIDAQPRVNQAQSQVAALRAELARAQADQAQTTSDADRYVKLAEKGAIPQQLAEQYASRVKVAQASVDSVKKQIAAAESFVHVTEATLTNPRIRAAEAQTTQAQIAETRAAVKLAETDVAAAQAGLERANADLAELTIASPVDGTVITRAAEPGRVAAAGQTILTVVDLATLYVRGFIPVAQSDLIKLGQQATVSLPSDSTVAAEVTRIDPQAMFTPENTYFKDDRIKQVVGVKLRLKTVDGKAKLGMPADAIIKRAGPGEARPFTNLRLRSQRLRVSARDCLWSL